jgi:AraC-like DNA-binding protein
MQGSVHHDRTFQRSFRLEVVPTVIARALRKAEIMVGDCRSEQPDGALSDPFPQEDAYLVGLQLRDYRQCENWEDGRPVSRHDVRAGDTLLYDLKRDPRFVVDQPFHAMFFHVPRAVLDGIAEDAHVPPVGELDYEPGVGRRDEVVKSLGGSMVAALARPEQASRMFIDHVTLAIAAHVAQAYGGLQRVVAPIKGGLAGWQQRRACEMLDANLDGSLALRDLAAECGLSLSHFSRAFRTSTGVAPHQWLLRRRVDVAKTLMQDRRLPLSEVALSAGFADQSHFTRIFSKMVGISPNAWRREATGVAHGDD